MNAPLIIDSLHEAIDKSAKDMLERCAQLIEGRPIPMTQQVEAFVAIVKWAETREKIRPKPPPPEKGETEFERIKRQYKGKQRKRSSQQPDDGEAQRAGIAYGPSEEGTDAGDAGADAADGALARDEAAAEIYLDSGGDS